MAWVTAQLSIMLAAPTAAADAMMAWVMVDAGTAMLTAEPVTFPPEPDVQVVWARA